MPRHLTPQAFWSMAQGALGRLACEHADPAFDDHDHEDCVVDDVSYAADLLLTHAAAIANGDDDMVLETLTRLQETLKEP